MVPSAQLEPANASKVVAFRPERLAVLANGLLSQHESNRLEAIAFKKSRLATLAKISEDPEAFALDTGSVLSQRVKDWMQLSVRQVQARAWAEATESLKEILALTESAAPGSLMSQRVLLHFFTLGVRFPGELGNVAGEEIRARMAATEKYFAGLTKISPEERFQKHKILLFYNAYQEPDKELRRGSFAKLFADRQATILEQELPEKYAELQQYRLALSP
jgi:hypothetical protein